MISSFLRTLLERGDHSLFAVARDSGVQLSSLSRFVSGEQDLKLDTLDRLADVLGLRLVETGRDRVKPSRSPRAKSARGYRPEDSSETDSALEVVDPNAARPSEANSCL